MAINWKMLAVLAVVIGAATLITFSLLFALTGGGIPFDYGVIIDAGSSHSEALLYKWKGDKNQGTGQVEQITDCEVKRGISTYDDPLQAGESLLPCLKQVASEVDEDKRKEVPVYLAATAGMRLLNMTNYYQSLAIFTALQCTIPKSSMSVKDVGIISGQDEGLYGWITTNFILGTLQEKLDTWGAIDMGGASTQISFALNAPDPNNTKVVNTKLYGKPYHVYSASYLCYGSLEIFRRYLASLIEDKLDELDKTQNYKVSNPCGNINQTLEYTATWLLDQPCTKTKKVTKYLFLNQEKLVNRTYTFEGSADLDECKKLVEVLFDEQKCREKHKECFSKIDSVARPGKVMAVSSYYFTMDYMKAKNSSLEEYREKVKEFCKKDYHKIPFDNEPKPVKEVIPRYCFQGIMVEVILKEYGFNETTWSQIEFANKVKGKSVGWALGYMTNATNAIPEEDPTKPVIGVPVLVIMLIVSLILLALGVYFYTRGRRESRSTSKGHA